MKTILSSLFLIIICINAKYSHSLEHCLNQIDCNKIKYKNIYSFEYNDLMGFKYFEEDGEYGSISGITLAYKNVFIGDPVYRTIHKINITNGEIEYGKKYMIEEDDWISDLIFFNNYIYVLTLKNFYIFNFDLELIKKIRYENEYFGYKPVIFSVNEDTLELKFISSLILFPKRGVCTIKITKEDIVFKELKEISETENSILHKQVLQIVRGKKSKIITDKNSIYMKTNYGNFELESEIPDNEFYCGFNCCPNFDFNEENLVYYTIAEKQMILSVFNY